MPFTLWMELARRQLAQRPGYLVWVGRACWPYPPALVAPPRQAVGPRTPCLLSHSLFLDPAHRTQRLWAAEQALHSPATAMLLIDGRNLNLTETRRLQLAAAAADIPALAAAVLRFLLVQSQSAHRFKGQWQTTPTVQPDTGSLLMPDTSFPLIFGVLALICGSANLSAGTIYQTTFQRNAWRQEDWIMVKSPRWESFHQWVQHKDHIANPIPEYAAEDQLVPGHQSYTSVVLNQAIDTTRGARIRSTMSFDYDQAPQIVIASALGQAEEGIAEYRDHYELVLFARGLNIWHHTYQDGQPYWRLVAYMPFSTESGRPYEMQVTVSNTRGKQPSERAGSGRLLTIEVAGHSFSYFAPGLPDSLYFGLIGYASTNRFYDFIVETLK